MTSSKFKLDDFLPYLLNRAAEEVSLDFQHHYKDRYGMLRTEWRVLAHLGERGTMTARDIGKQARIHKTKISRAIVALEGKRFLKRITADNDRRFEMLDLTQTGKAAFKDLSKIALGYDRKLQTLMKDTDIIQLRETLKNLAAQFE